jgi:trehalose synthase
VNGAQVGLLHRPIVCQISRWDRLKGFGPLLEAFVRLKRRLDDPVYAGEDGHRRRLEATRLVLAGPDPSGVSDDPEAREVLDELTEAYGLLPEKLQEDVVLLRLPMESRKENALMVNALQRCSTIVVQNSIREGFGLTATEAMWKRLAVIGTHACGLRQQIRPGVDGLLVRDPLDPDEVADTVDRLLRDVPRRQILARNAQRRVHKDFLIFSQLSGWLRLLAECVDGAS